jgi:hypothetical protein
MTVKHNNVLLNLITGCLYWLTTYFGQLYDHHQETQLIITFKVNKTISKRLAPKTCNTNPQQQYERSGVYCLTCPDCHMKYVGQTDSSFHRRHKEHFHDFKYNIRKSRFAIHLLDNKHSMGPIYGIMDILYTTGKGKFMDTVERFHVYNETRKTTKLTTKTRSNRMPSLM